VQGVQAEELVHDGAGLDVEFLARFARVEGFVEVLDDHVLRVGARQAVEVDQQVVPGFLLLVAVLEGFKGQEGAAPGEGRYEVLIFAEDVEGGADVGLVEEVLEDEGGVVAWLVSLENRASRFEELADSQ